MHQRATIRRGLVTIPTTYLLYLDYFLPLLPPVFNEVEARDSPEFFYILEN